MQYSPQEQQLLEQLGSLQTAPTVWLMPAIGWWVLALLIVCGIGLSYLLLQRFSKQRRERAYQKQALSMLNALSPQQYPSASVNTLLKQVAMQTYGRKSCAHLSGQAWLDFLQQQQPRIAQPQGMASLLAHHSQSQSASVSAEVITYCKAWIKACPAPKPIGDDRV